MKMRMVKIAFQRAKWDLGNNRQKVADEF